MGSSSIPPLSLLQALLLWHYGTRPTRPGSGWFSSVTDEIINLPDLDKYGERRERGLSGRGRRREDKRERVGKTAWRGGRKGRGREEKKK